MVHLRPRTTTTSSPSSSSSLSSQGNTAVEATGDPTASALTPNTYLNAIRGSSATNTSAIQNSTTSAEDLSVNVLSEKEEYERNFFLLRVLVLGTIGCVFSTLTLMFWVYFMYLWRTWDAGKRDSGSVSMPNEDLEIQRVSFCSGIFHWVIPFSLPECAFAEHFGRLVKRVIFGTSISTLSLYLELLFERFH